MTATHPGPRADDAALHLLADHLVTALAADELEPCLLHVRPDEHFELGTRALDGHPTDVLLGFVAPDDWHAVGLATHGWAYDIRERGRPERGRRRVHVVSLVSRTGEHAHRTQVEGEPELTRRLADEDPAGEQIDLLRRALDLPTPPPPCGAEVYWSIEWLAALVTVTKPTPTTWAEAVARHPATVLLSNDATPIDADTGDILAGFHRVCDWARLRRLAVDAAFRAPELRADHAAWLDDGAFARFVLNRCPPMPTLRARLVDHAPPGVAARVLDTLDALGVPERAWPDDASSPA